MTTLFDPIRIGGIRLPHRLALAPMTRNRANHDGTPGPFTATYYAQRASFGLLISEGVHVSDDGQRHRENTAIVTAEQVGGWRAVADGVHLADGHLVVQLLHLGRYSHPDNTLDGLQPVGPSPVGAGVAVYTAAGKQSAPVPRALSTGEVAGIVDDFRMAAAAAIRAGADGVEIHGANGFLLQQFLAPNSNRRTDRYGGTIENRARFVVEIAEAVAGEIGAARTGIRLSPHGTAGGLDEGDEAGDLYRFLVGELASLDLAYLHLVHSRDEELLGELRAAWPNALLLVRADRTVETLGGPVESGLADVIPIGRAAIANPDFVERLRGGSTLADVDSATVLSGGARGYTDYPCLDQASTPGSP
jgi:2,4-dienoyl-CoA reductase-like NADH-dependent reductase (Old Yellow Enzyme family)